MSFPDMLLAIEGYGDSEMAEANRMRHLMWAPIAAMGNKITPRRLMPLPIDGNDKVDMTRDEFLQLAKKYKIPKA
jgi:hypothetical protein